MHKQNKLVTIFHKETDSFEKADERENFDLKARAKINVQGIVQGIGFRPFIYRSATKRGLTGYVLNMGDAGVRILVEGEKDVIKDFIKNMDKEKPPLSKIINLSTEWKEFKEEFDDFSIIKSKKGKKGPEIGVFPPDISICSDCIQDIFNKGRRNNYVLISCTNCGPRFTVIDDLPYDRERTSMIDFPLCDICRIEFNDPITRWLNAQTMACPICGPSVFLTDNEGNRLKEEDPIKKTAEILEKGNIVAIKGIGGIHLAVITSVDEPVVELRKRRRKSEKPFAVMSPDLESVQKFAFFQKSEEELLTSFRRPIVILKKRNPFPLSELISPGLHNIGVMLCYSGLHYLLFNHLNELALIMTSGNYPSEPMLTDNDVAIKKLKNVADYFLLHNRRIINRCDDSVIKVFSKKEHVFLRRSRGYVPDPIEIPIKNGNGIAVGPEQDVTSTVAKNGKAFMSQHIGDVDNLDALEHLDTSTNHLMKLLKIRSVDTVVCDLHPKFLTTRFAKEVAEKYNAKFEQIQQHHAHAVSLMADSKNYEKNISVVADGFAFGAFDEVAWGGEVLLASLRILID